MQEIKLERLETGLKEIFNCLIKANQDGVITDTIWVTNTMTLWDYMANLLEMQGDQNEIEKQIVDEMENKQPVKSYSDLLEWADLHNAGPSEYIDEEE